MFKLIRGKEEEPVPPPMDPATYGPNHRQAQKQKQHMPMAHARGPSGLHTRDSVSGVPFNIHGNANLGMESIRQSSGSGVGKIAQDDRHGIPHGESNYEANAKRAKWN